MKVHSFTSSFFANNRVSAANDDQKRGVEIVRQALRTPCLQIASNAGVDASVIVNKVNIVMQLYL